MLHATQMAFQKKKGKEKDQSGNKTKSRTNEVLRCEVSTCQLV